jgi:hypothetical protein
MLVLPIINRNRILNVEVNLKNAVKVSDEFYTKDIRPSDIVVNGNSYYEYLNLKHLTTSTTSSVMEFVRLSSKSGTKSILVSTKTDDNNKYDVYRITKITDKISDGFDSLIGTLILDLKNRTPSQKNRYLDLKKLQVFDIISESSLEKIEYASANLERLNISKYISDNNLGKLFRLIKDFDQFDFTIINKSIISLADFERILEFLEPVNSKDYINLKHYYDIARNNQREYSKLSYLYKTVSNKPLDIIHSAKKKVKVYEDDAA